jgi:hypothetical protein
MARYTHPADGKTWPDGMMIALALAVFLTAVGIGLN